MDTFDYDMPFERLSVGDTVPEELSFEVFQNDETKTMSFSDLRGKWAVVFFYPADFTFVCPTELGELATLYAEFQKEGAEIVSFSTDTKYVHKAWHDTSDTIKMIQFPMGADPSHEVSEVFGILNEEAGESRRGTFIVSPDGVIKAVEVTDNSIGRKAKETLRKLKAAKYVSAHPGNVCPASWEEGDEVLTEGLNLVGKI